ncbi:putative serine protease K12H4.7 [Phlebotomus argentipes]|uniref:putative serine protease K12H4.7 n=1 Tax=Phlebotomus argentipes TaxID=94469 RepID=UPI002892B152|nr:putative serine protease K12H4.7 [Phlebotomus argentipes]
MKTSGILCFLLLSIGVFQVKSNPFSIFERLHHEPPLPEPKLDTKVVNTRWIEQKLDHFDDSNTVTFQMRYMENAEFYQEGGPIFIFVGGEYTIQEGWLLGGHMFDMARELNGYIFYTEHRFYGETRPTPDLSFENLQYLTVDQALEDMAHFIRVKKQEIPGASSSGVILVGGSYPGTIATWMRQRYPELVNGAWSSSGPLLAKTDFYEYIETVGQSLRLVGGEACYNRIYGAFAEMERLVEVGDFETLSQTLNLCNTLPNNQLDIWYFFNTLTNIMSWVVQDNWPGYIEGACDIIMAGETDIDGYADFVSFYLLGSCINVNFDLFVQFYSETSWTGGPEYMRQWLFQTCNEFGWYQTSGSDNQPFGSSFPVEFMLQWCHDIYDESFNPDAVHQNINVTNQNNNGLNPIITNVYSTHGQLDPWRPMGVQTDVNSFAPTVVIPMASHCADLYSISDDDSPEMLASKLRIASLVRQWLMIF